jgi:uncharacterized membrane protein
MNPQLLALLTAAAWGIGGYFEKKGLHLGGLSPQVGITIRTAVALLVLGIVSFPQWKTIPQAGSKALIMMVIGGAWWPGRWACYVITPPSTARLLPRSCRSPLLRRYLAC